MSQDTHDSLLLPALRAHMGDWVYYITFMKMTDISQRVRVARDIHKSKALNEYIQRQLKKSHAHGITKYLISQPQRMFNAMVIGVYEGEPDWYELSVGPGHAEVHVPVDDFPSYIDGALGLLRLDGGEKLFAIDGQHRVVGIQRAVAENPKLGDEEVSAIFVAHRNDPEGLQRTRRLFTTLNKTAKRVTKADIIALDEDDVVAIVTRRLIDEYPLFADPYLTNAGTKSLPVTDAESFTNIITLYDCVDVYLGKPNKKNRLWQEYHDIDERYEQVVQLWCIRRRKMAPLGEGTAV